MNDFPRMLYKFPGAEPIHGALFATKIVQDQDEQDAADDEGWKLTTPEAKEAHAEASKPASAPVPVPEPSILEEDKAAAEAAGDQASGQDEPAEPSAADDEAFKAEREQLKAEAAGLALVFPRNATNDKLRSLIAAARGQV